MLHFLISKCLLAFLVYPLIQTSTGQMVHYNINLRIDMQEKARFQYYQKKGQNLKESGLYKLALKEFEECVTILEENKIQKTLAASFVYYNIGDAAIQLGNGSEDPDDYMSAAFYYEKGLAIQYNQINVDTKLIYYGHDKLAQLYEKLQLDAMAILHVKYLYRYNLREYGKFHNKTYPVNRGLADLYRKVENHNESIPLYKILAKFPRENRSVPLVSNHECHLYLAKAYTFEKKWNKASKYYNKVTQSRRFDSKEPILQAEIIHDSGVVLGKLGEFNKSLAKLESSFDLLKNETASNAKILGSKILYDTGIVYTHQNNYNEACDRFDKAYMLYVLIKDQYHPTTATIFLRGRAYCYQKQNLNKRALEMYDQIAKILHHSNATNTILMMSRNNHNIGKVYYELKEYFLALHYHFKGLQQRLTMIDILPDHLVGYSYWEVCKALKEASGFYAAFFYCEKACRLATSPHLTMLCQRVQSRPFWNNLLAFMRHGLKELTSISQEELLATISQTSVN